MSRATVADVLAGIREPHELRADLHDLWRDGFAAGRDRMQARVDEAEAQADHWFFEASNPVEARRERERHLERHRAVLARTADAERWRALDRLAEERAAEVRGGAA